MSRCMYISELRFSQFISLVRGLLDHMVILYLVFKESPLCSPQWLYEVMFPPRGQQSPFLHIFSKRLFFDGGHSDLYTCVSHSVMSTLCGPMDYSHQAPLSMEFCRQEYYNGLPFPSLGKLPNPEIKPRSPTLQVDSLPSQQYLGSSTSWEVCGVR